MARKMTLTELCLLRLVLQGRITDYYNKPGNAYGNAQKANLPALKTIIVDLDKQIYDECGY